MTTSRSFTSSLLLVVMTCGLVLVACGTNDDAPAETADASALDDVSTDVSQRDSVDPDAASEATPSPDSATEATPSPDTRSDGDAGACGDEATNVCCCDRDVMRRTTCSAAGAPVCSAGYGLYRGDDCKCLPDRVTPCCAPPGSIDAGADGG
jgi:hypothetical protein